MKEKLHTEVTSTWTFLNVGLILPPNFYCIHAAPEYQTLNSHF